MRGRRIAGAAFALGLAAGAAGFVQSTSDTTGVPLSWPTNLVPFSVNPDVPHAAPSCAGGAALAAVRASFATWQQGCSSLELVDAGTVPEIRTGSSGTGENLVVFRQGWCRARLPPDTECLRDPDVDCGGLHNCFEDSAPADRFTLALTSVLYFPDSGRIVDADIEVNGWDGGGAGTEILPGGTGDTREPPANGWYFTCNEDPGPNCTTYGQEGCRSIDLQGTVTHEVGHFIGLRHVCDPGSSADAGLPSCDDSHAEITMYPLTQAGDLGMRTLHPDDVAGVCAIYPVGRSPARPSSSGGGCAAGGAGGALALLLAAAALARTRRR